MNGTVRWWSWPPPVHVAPLNVLRALLALLAVALATGAIRATLQRPAPSHAPTYTDGRPADYPSIRCVALTKAGQQCRNYARRGTTLCRVHTKSPRR